MARHPPAALPYPAFVTAAVVVLVATHLQPGASVVAKRGSPLYATSVLFFAGASAGAIVTGRLIQTVRWSGAATLVTLADVGAVVGVALALAFVALDLARQEYLRRLAWSVHFAPLDVMIVALYLSNALALAWLVSHVPLDGGGPRHWLRALLATHHRQWPDPADAGRAFGELLTLLLPAALLLQCTPAWILRRLGDASGWQATEIAAFCYGSSIIAGFALMLAAAGPNRLWLGAGLDEGARRALGTTLLLAIPVVGYCLFGETRAVIAAEEPGATHLFRELLRGGYAVFFWSDLLIAVGVPLALIASSRTPTTLRLGVAGALMAVGVLLERGTLVVALLLGHAHRLYSAGGYAPGLDEIATTAAVYLAGLLAFLALARRSLIGRP